MLLPTFTNTELISGTHPSAAQKPVEPADIAAGVVKLLDKPRTALSVPEPLRAISIVSTLLPPRGRRWLNRKLGNERVFLDFDRTARAGYEQRAEGSTGIED